MSCTYIIDGKAYNEENLLKKFNSPVERQQQAIQWLKQNTNATDADFLPVVDGLLTNGALGRMMEDGKFLFSNLAPESVIYHEAFHRIYNFFATDEERLKLIEDFKKSKGYKNRIAELNSIYNSPKRIETRGKVLTEEDLIEEALAEEFQEFKLGGQVQNKLKETIFTKILNFIKDLLNLSKKLDNISYRRQFYQRIVDGQFSHSPKLISKIEQYKDSVFENIKGLSTENVIDVTNSIHGRFIENALKKSKLYDIVDGNNTDYDELFNDAFWDTVEELDVINPKIGDNVALSVNQLKDRHKLILKDFNILTEDVENLEDKLFSDEKSKDTEFNKNSVEFDPRASMKKAAKLVLSTLTHSQVNSVGLPTNVSYREVNNILLRNLSNVPTDIEEYLYTVNKLSNKFPYLTKLHSLLSENSSNNRLVGDFIDSFNNTFVNYNLITDVGGNLKTVSSADASIKNNVIADWKLNLENNINTNPNIVEELSNFKINRKTLYKFYNLLGIADVKFTDQALTEAGLIQSIIKSKKDLKPKDLLTIFDVKDTTFKTEKGYNLSYIFSDLALEEYKNRDDIDVMIFNIEGKPVYPVTQYNYLSMTIGWMNYYKQKFYDNSDIKEQFKERGLRAYLETKMPHLFNVQTINSKYFNEFFNNSDQNLNYSLFLGVKIGKNELDFKTATEADYYVTALKMFLQNKEIFSLTQGDRQIFPTFKIPYLINDIGIMTSAYIGYIKDEVEKFKLLEKNPSIISKMDIDFSKTIIDPEIFNIKDAFSNYDNLDEYLDSKRNEIYKSLTNFVNKNKAYYIKVLKDELELKINKLFNKSDLGTASFENLVENWFINQYMGNIEQFKLFYGDISLFGDYSNLWKRLNTPTSTGSPGNVSEYLLDELNNEDDKYTIGDFNYRISRENAGVHKTTIKEQFLKDKDTESEVVSNIEAIAKAKYEKLFKVFDWKEIYKKEQKKIDKFEGNTPLEKLINYKVAKDTAPYRKITEGDGFSYLNLYEWKRIMKIWKLWTDKHDRLFEREYEVLKITMNKELSNEQKMEEINNLFASNSIDVDDYFDQHEQASLLKPQYSGVIYDKPFTEYVQLSSKERMNIYGIRKTSFMPLLPSVIFGTGLEKMHEKMLLSGTGVVFYESAAKVGAVKKDKMYNSDDVVSMENNQFIDDTSTYLNYQYLKNQLYIKSEEKKSIIDSTQSRKNMIADKYHQKVPIDFILKNADEGKTFKDIKTDWNSLSEKDKLVNSELHSYVEEYLKTLNVIIDRNTKLLLAELDIKNLDESFEDFDIKNIKKLLKLLKKQARSRNNTLDIIDAFQYMIDRGSTLFNVFPNQSKLESILTSMVTSNVIKFKRIGSDYAQVSPVMWETKDSKRIDNNKTNPKVLKFYSEDLKPSEVMIPAPKDLLKKLEQAIKNPKDNKEIFKYYQAIKGDYPDGFNIKLLTDLLNKLIEVGYLDTEVTFKALRIPNQELSSNDVIKVKKFLLPTMSKMVVINAEMVAKTGSDFDIDKLNVYFKYLDKSLKTIKYTEGTDEESISQRFKSHSQERIQSMIENLLDKDISSISKEISNIYEDIATLKKEFSDELEDYQDLKEESGELYQQYKSEMATVLDSFKQDIITYNQSNSQFDFKLSEQEIQELENVNTIGKLKHFLFKIKTNKENELGNSLIILRSIKNDLNEKLNNLYKTLPKNKDPFLNKEFSNLHSEYTKAKDKLEQYLDENDNSYKTVLATILQLDTIFDSVNNLKEVLNVKNKTKNELNEKINEEFFEKIKQLKFQKEIWQNMELELFKKLPIEVQNSSSALYNKLSEIEENLILNEWNLSDLLHPIGDGGLKEFLEEEIEPTQNESDRFSIKEKKALYHSLHPSNNLSKKLDLKEAEIGIGQFATHLTHHSIGRDIVLYPTMFSKKHKQTLSMELKFDGFQNDYSLDNYLTSDIENIFQLISGHLTTQVDAAKEPYAVYLNIKNNTIPIISYLIRRGVSKDIVYRFMTQPKVLEYISKSGNYRSLSYKFSNNKLYSTFFSPSKVAFKKIFNLKEKEKLSFDFENINSMSLKDLKTKQDDISFQKNAVLYFISLEEQAKTFNNLRKLMSSDTTFHKSLSSYKELMNLQKEVEETRMFGNDIKPYLEQGFIKPFTKSAKLYYHPWKSLFLSSREFASYIGNYIDIYSNAIADSLGLSKQDSEKRTKIRNSMERQFFAFIKDSYVKPQTNIDVASALSYIGKNYKAINVKKLFSVLMNYGLENKKNVVQSKLKSFTPFEINNYILLFRKLATVKAINISNNETVTGEELVKAIYYQHLKQTKNDFSPFAIDTLIPGNIKMEVLSQILDEFLKKESSNFNEIFTKFVKEFQLANDRYIGYGTFKGLLGKSTENFGEETSYTTIKDEFENSYESKSFAYDSNLESEDVENVTPSEDNYDEDSKSINDYITQPLSELQKLKDFHKTPIITKNSIKNIYFFDGASKDTVNGSNAYLNDSILDFEKGVVYIKTPSIVLDGEKRDSKKLKIGTYEIENGSKQVTINFNNVYASLKRNTKQQESMPQQSEVNTVEQNVKTYTGKITSLKDNQVFVFGANPEGRHGAGTASVAKGFGLQNGKLKSEKTFGLITKDLMGYANFDKSILQVTPFGGVYYESDGATFWKDKVEYKGKTYKKLDDSTATTGNLQEGLVQKGTQFTRPSEGGKWLHKLPADFIKVKIQELYEEAKNNPNKEYLIAYGKEVKRSLNGYTSQELADMFSAFSIPSNIVFEKEFSTLTKQSETKDTQITKKETKTACEGGLNI